MNSGLEQAFLEIIRLGIGNGRFNANLLNYLPQTIDWNSLEALAMRQGLLGIIVDGVEKLPEGQRPPQTLLLQWIGQTVEGFENCYESYCRTIAEMAGWYNRHGYKMMLLKGLACGLDWPKPRHRPYGDIDIWLFGKQKEADETHAKELGVKIDKSHHHHTVFNWNGFMVENHYDFINVHHHKSNVEFESILKELGQDDSRFIMVNGEKVYLPSHNLNALFLLKHMMNHFAAEGITIRQVLDWAFFVKAHKDEVDWMFVENILERFGMKRMYKIINAICDENLGFLNTDFSVSENCDMELKDRVLKEILLPEISRELPKKLIRRVPFKYRRWKANEWKHKLCYNESMTAAFWSGVWNHDLKPSSI